MKYIVLLCLLISLGACVKGPGPGGRATIKGKIWARNLATGLGFVTDSGWAAQQNVYISFGDNTAIGDKVETSFDGSFEFLYLRAGNYKIYTYTKKLYGIDKLDSAVVKNITLSGNATEDVGTIYIYTNKN